MFGQDTVGTVPKASNNTAEHRQQICSVWGHVVGDQLPSGSSIGSPLEIKCVAFFGTNIETGCEVRWEKNNLSISGMEGYHQTFLR